MVTYLAKILECIRDGEMEKAKNLSRVLMSEGNYFKGFCLFGIIYLNKKRANRLFQNKKLLKFF